MTLTKEQFVTKFKNDKAIEKAEKKRAEQDIVFYQCEARRRMKRLYKGTKLRTRKGIQFLSN